MGKSAIYYKRGEKKPRSFEGHRGVFMGYRVDLEKNATDRVFLLKFFSWVHNHLLSRVICFL